MEETSLKYALLAQVVRDGGFKIPIIMRFSAFPGHRASPPLSLPSPFLPSLPSLVSCFRSFCFAEEADGARTMTVLTAIFSTLGMTLWTFLGSALLGLPKQLAVVYIGVSSSSDDPGESCPSLSHSTYSCIRALTTAECLCGCVCNGGAGGGQRA